MKSEFRIKSLVALCFVAVWALGIAPCPLSAADYKQCIVLDIQKPSNKIVLEGDNSTDNVILDAKMLYFNTGDNFTVTVTNKCKESGELYVTVQVPGEGSTVARYYHYLDTEGVLPTLTLSESKEPYAEDFPKGASATLWSFIVTKDLTFHGPVVFEAVLVKEEKPIGFDAKTLYINYPVEP
uniref:Uncharacterized protein n=1 Tax=Desulfacinum infernum TaxID=35837 RepID=A0A832A4B4_9BACT